MATIIKLIDKKTNTEYYMEWSTVLDAPLTNGMSLEDFKIAYKEEYGNNGMHELEKRLERVEQKGTSSMLDRNVDDTISCNRAGEKGKKLSKSKIIELFCVNPVSEIPYYNG